MAVLLSVSHAAYLELSTRAEVEVQVGGGAPKRC